MYTALLSRLSVLNINFSISVSHIGNKLTDVTEVARPAFLALAKEFAVRKIFAAERVLAFRMLGAGVSLRTIRTFESARTRALEGVRSLEVDTSAAVHAGTRQTSVLIWE